MYLHLSDCNITFLLSLDIINDSSKSVNTNILFVLISISFLLKIKLKVSGFFSFLSNILPNVYHYEQIHIY